MEAVTKIIAVVLGAGTSLLYATLGEVYTERGGILNLGVEGMMMLSALSAFAVSFYTGSLLLAVIIAMLVGGVMALIHAFLSITMRANQVVSGLSITLFGTGLASYLGQRLGPISNTRSLVGVTAANFPELSVTLFDKVPVLSALFNQDIMTYILYLLVPLAWIYMYRTKSGLSLRAVGEDPKTAAAVGISVSRVRYLYTIVGGMLTGVGGAHLTLGYTQGWAENVTGGRGWIVIALVIFSGWNPGKAVIGAVLFGGISQIQLSLQAFGLGAVIPSFILKMTPYIMTIVVLTIMTLVGRKRKSSYSPPSALGTSFSIEDK